MKPEDCIGLPLTAALEAMAKAGFSMRTVYTAAPRPMGPERPLTPRVISVRGDVFLAAAFPDRLEERNA